MGKTLKISIIITGILIALFFAAKWYSEIRFERLLNSNPERQYDIVYKDLDIEGLFTGASMEEVRIIARDTTHASEKTKVNGYMHHLDLAGMSWLDLAFSNKISIKRIIFEKPDFTVFLGVDSTDHRTKAGTSFQNVFEDVLSRAELSEFDLLDGSVQIVSIQDGDTSEVATIERFSIKAREIQVDSILLTHLIPFEVGSIQTQASGLSFHPNKYSELKLENLSYNSLDADLQAENASMRFNEDWRAISLKMGTQVDMIEFDLKSLRITGLGTKSSIYGAMKLEAAMIEVDSLLLDDGRNRNVPRPPDKEKPMFNGMIDLIPVQLDIDSIILKNSRVTYSEVSKGKSDPGVVSFAEINGKITQITNDSLIQQSVEFFYADLTARLNDQAPLIFKMRVPYAGESFDLNANITSMDPTILNQTLEPLVSIKIESGTVHEILLSMSASETQANSNMAFIYENLSILVLQQDESHKSGFMSIVANAIIQNSNLKSDKHYTEPEYFTDRNIYRGPFNLMWETIKDGMTIIVPNKTGTKLLQKSEKKNNHP